MRTPNLAILALILIVAFAAAGCDDEWRTVELELTALAAPDSVAEGQGLPVQFTYMANGSFTSHVFVALDDSTVRLRAFRRFRETDRAVGAPAFPIVVEVVLEDPPARDFRIVHGGLVLPVQGGAQDATGNRLTVLVRDEIGPLEDVVLRVERTDAGGEYESLTLDPTDAEGRVVLSPACLQPETRMVVESAGEGAWVFGLVDPGPCDRPLTLVPTVRRPLAR